MFFCHPRAQYGIVIYILRCCHISLIYAHGALLAVVIGACLCHDWETMPRDLSPVIHQLIRWRTANNLSQSEAVRILANAGLPVKLGTLQHWEIGHRSPHPVTAGALSRFLEEHPRFRPPRSRDKGEEIPKILPPVIQQLMRWRKANRLSQAQAAHVLVDAGLPVSVRTLQSWEIGRRAPQPLSAAALGRFLEEHPNVSIGRGKPRD
jgi:DNA-binding transcriptional regulator YiaG